jgi:hypothetical protein
MELLYTRSWQDKNLLRNRELHAPWVAEYLDRGKPGHLVAHSRSRSLRNQSPVVIRPDLLQTEDGFALSEIDSVPGGIGLTAYLNGLYGGEAAGIIGGDSDAMLMAFYESLSALVPDKKLPLVAILVSDEAATYRPEMEWAAASLQRKGLRVHCQHVNDLMPLGDAWCVDVDGNPEEVDVIYRFWELFDEPNVPVMQPLLEAVEAGRIAVSPPMRHFRRRKTEPRSLPPPPAGRLLAREPVAALVQATRHGDPEVVDRGSGATAAQRRARRALGRRQTHPPLAGTGRGLAEGAQPDPEDQRLPRKRLGRTQRPAGQRRQP